MSARRWRMQALRQWIARAGGKIASPLLAYGLVRLLVGLLSTTKWPNH
jgi:hypothetical protein